MNMRRYAKMLRGLPHGLTAKAACGLVNDKRHFSIASRRMLKDMAFKERATVMDVHVTIKGKTMFCYCYYSFYSKLSEQRPLTDSGRSCSHIIEACERLLVES